jgi:hypothetical protein
MVVSTGADGGPADGSEIPSDPPDSGKHAALSKKLNRKSDTQRGDFIGPSSFSGAWPKMRPFTINQRHTDLKDEFTDFKDEWKTN